MRVASAALGAALVLTACQQGPVVPGAALESITAEDLRQHVTALADDSLLGRPPSGPGAEATVRYLRNRFEALGLRPGNGESWVQEVPLVSITADTSTNLLFRGRSATMRLGFGDDFVAWTKRVTEQTALRNSELVFVGYGIEAPEYGWNDYEGLDVRGKTVIILVNDPGFATDDSTLFTGRAMTYYGRWTYKYEEAARQGAEGAIIVHETAPAAYGWNVVQNSWTGPQFDLEAPDANMSRVAVEGWITLDVARELFQNAGLDYDALRDRAATRNFDAVPLEGMTASITITNTIERSTSDNVVTLLPGTDRADEYVMYTAHWDHLGVDPNLQGDSIYNGARDNATGTATLLELAQAFRQSGVPPARSIMFLAVTAEEQGLLGSAYFARNPLVPLAQVAGVINMDAMNIFGPLTDVTVIGYGKSELDAYVERAAAAQGRTVLPDAEPEKGYYYRSDHFSFAKQGVPALYIDEGVTHVEHGRDWTMQRKDEYTAERYHGVEDEVTPEWDFRGLAEDARLLFRIGYALATAAEWPNWHEGTEFRAARDAMMR